MNDLKKDISLEVFISYSHEDSKYLQELEKHLALLKRTKVISVWTDRCIPVGGTWEDKLDAQLETADIIIFLITPDFLASNYCYDKELQTAIKKHKYGGTSLFPIVVKPVDWINSIFSEYQILPRNGKPIIKWKNGDEAWLNIIKEIRDFLENQKKELLEKNIKEYIQETSNKRTATSPLFLLNDFNPIANVKIKYNENNASIPCRFEKISTLIH